MCVLNSVMEDSGFCRIPYYHSQRPQESIQISVCSVRLQALLLFTFIFSSVLPALWISNSSNSCNSFVENILLDTDDFLQLYKVKGEGNGTRLQYSCLENPMGGGAWWAAVHGVAKSQTRLSDFTFTFHFHALEKEMATHSRVLAWRIPGTGEPGGLPSMGLHRVGHY